MTIDLDQGQNTMHHHDVSTIEDNIQTNKYMSDNGEYYRNDINYDNYNDNKRNRSSVIGYDNNIHEYTSKDLDSSSDSESDRDSGKGNV